ncbi:MAG: hypothetical protein SGBAC_012658 [Bacillariaceae sp.]
MAKLPMTSDMHKATNRRLKDNFNFVNLLNGFVSNQIEQDNLEGTSAVSNAKQGDNHKRRETQASYATNVPPKKSRAAVSTTMETSNPCKTLPAGGVTSTGLIFNIHFDGGARGNPGIAGAGAEVVLSRAEIVQVVASSTSSTIQDGHTTSIVLETLKSKQYPMSDGHRVTLIVHGDSKLIIQQVKGVYHCAKTPTSYPIVVLTND